VRTENKKECIMRSTKKFATALGITLGLALVGVPQMAAAQAGAAFQDQGVREEMGDSIYPQVRATVHESYAQETNKPARASTGKLQRTTASATQARAAQQPGNASANGAALPGYSARSEGRCWIREVGSGHDLTGGYWGACPKTH
jgi:hypothetical protein